MITINHLSYAVQHAVVTLVKKKTTKMAKISKVIIYYEDGTYQEVTPGVHLVQGEKNKEPSYPSPINPGMPYQPRYVSPTTVDPSMLPPWTITCTTTGENLNWKMTSTENAPLNHKYTMTSTGNGNVEISK